MHATEDQQPSAGTALTALQHRLDPALAAHLVQGDEALSVVNPDAPQLHTVAVIIGTTYAVDLGAGEKIPIGPVDQPDAAAARVNHMLATVSP